MKKMMVLLLMLNISMVSFALVDYHFNVKDDAGEPIAGATIIVIQTVTGTVTDMNGDALITTGVDNPRFSVSHIGKLPAIVIAVKNKFRYDVILHEPSTAYNLYQPITSPWKSIISYSPWEPYQMV